MEFRQLRYFLAVAEHLHFTEAAAHLGIAQPPLSQQILKLEREIGTKLFIRHPRRVELTEAGRLLQESARRIVEDAQLALTEVQNAGRGESGHLSLGFAGSTVFHPLVATVMQNYRNAYPRVVIRCEESNSSALLDKVSEGHVDAALVRLPLHCRDLVVQPWQTTPLFSFPGRSGPIFTIRSSLRAYPPDFPLPSAWSLRRFRPRRIWSQPASVSR